MTPSYRVQLLICLVSYVNTGGDDEEEDVWMERLVSLPFPPIEKVDIRIGDFSTTPNKVAYYVLDSLFVCYCGVVAEKGRSGKDLREEHKRLGWRDRTIDSYAQE